MIPDASKLSLQGFIKDNVQLGNTVVTDGWTSYASLEQEGYPHIVERPFDEAEDEVLPHVHLIASLLKRWLLGTHQGAVRESHLQLYLDEYVFRFNRRKAAKRGLQFNRLLENAMLVPPTIQDDILGRKPF